MNEEKPKRKRRTPVEMAAARALEAEKAKVIEEVVVMADPDEAPLNEVKGSIVNEFIFIGNGKDDPEIFSVYGYVFKLNGKPVEIVDDFAINKLSVNGHFKRV